MKKICEEHNEDNNEKYNEDNNEEHNEEDLRKI